MITGLLLRAPDPAVRCCVCCRYVVIVILCCTFNAGVVGAEAGDVLVDVAVLAGFWRTGAHAGTVLGTLGVTLHRCGTTKTGVSHKPQLHCGPAPPYHSRPAGSSQVLRASQAMLRHIARGWVVRRNTPM